MIPLGPDDRTHSSSGTPVTGIEESDPNADSAEGLAGEMGVSSERKGPVRGQPEPVTYAAGETHPAIDEVTDPPPEQSAFDGRPEVNPDPPA